MEKTLKQLEDSILENVNIIDFIRDYVQLEKAKLNNYKANCPFHKETKKSFIVNEEKNIGYCFECNQGGNVIQLAQLLLKLDKPQAIKFLENMFYL